MIALPMTDLRNMELVVEIKPTRAFYWRVAVGIWCIKAGLWLGSKVMGNSLDIKVGEE